MNVNYIKTTSAIWIPLVRGLICCACFLLLSREVGAQNTIGLPGIVNYSDQDYHGGFQTWAVQQGRNGVLYFANNEGVLSFDGNYWKQYALPNKTLVRSILIDSLNGTIYVGSQNEIGYFSTGRSGDLVYTSLTRLIPEKLRNFADIWQITTLGNAVFFRGNQQIFEYRDSTIRVFQAASEWHYLKNIAGRLLAQDAHMGLLAFTNNHWEPVCTDPALQEALITGILDYRNDTLLITTLRNGIFLLHGTQLQRKATAIDDIVTTSRIYCAAWLNRDRIALGTTSNGCYIINAEGKLIQTISHTDGLQNNNILCLFVDHTGNVWMGLDNGIDYIAYSTAIKKILPDKLNQLAGYAIKVYKDQLYIGTSDGLYTVPLQFTSGDLSFSKGSFTRVPNTNGQVWNVDETGQQVLMGHHDGSFVINHNQPAALMRGTGTWLFVPLQGALANTVIAGTYNGLELLEYDGKQLVDKGKIEGLQESLRFLVADNNNTLWASHPHTGVYKIRLSPDRKKLSYQLYAQQQGLPANYDNYVYFIKGRVMVGTRKGIYEYNAATDAFVPSAVMPGVLKGKPIRYLTEDVDGNVWFETEKRIGVIDYNKPSGSDPFSILYLPELTDKMIRGFEYIYPYNSENIFIGSQKGILHLNYHNYLQQASDLSVLIGKVKTVGNTDSLVYGGYTMGRQQPAEPDMPSKMNSFHFEYSCPVYGQHSNIEYSYQLAGFDTQWSPWTKKTEKDYTNLPYGSYTFMVKARNNIGNESSAVSYSFRINPAWYQTLWAWLLYCLLLATAIYGYARRQRKKFARQHQQNIAEQEHLRYMHQLERNNDEKEIIKLRNERLESDVEFKNRELASATMHLVERGKVLSTIKEELMHMQRAATKQALSIDFRRVLNILNNAEKNEDYWEQFVSHFDQVYSNYLGMLKIRFPLLSATDLKLCAYLRMNLSSKEISQLMNISVRGVEIARYRLRKKLQLPTDENLADYLINIETG